MRLWVTLIIFRMEYGHVMGWLRRLLVEAAVYLEMGWRVCIFFSMISDCGYGHFCYMVGSALLWYIGWFYCVALLSSHGDA